MPRDARGDGSDRGVWEARGEPVVSVSLRGGHGRQSSAH